MPLFRLYQYSIVVGCKTRERLELGTLNFICSISTKNKQHVFFLEEDEGGGGGGSDLLWQSYALFSTRL